jgi:DNA-binding CsgD family transcriptional regulator
MLKGVPTQIGERPVTAAERPPRNPVANDSEGGVLTSGAKLNMLDDYFRSPAPRGHDIDAPGNLGVSARELDCLKWVAAGKSAWEASVILGISERTVRFHLNSAREKLNCTTTTQAVAKVVAQKLIAI